MEIKNIKGIDLVIPKNEWELYDLIEPLVSRCGEDLTDETILEGNHDKTYAQLKELCILSNWNVALEKEQLDNADHIDTVYLQDINIPALMAANTMSGFLWIEGADEVSVEPQGIRFWFD